MPMNSCLCGDTEGRARREGCAGRPTCPEVPAGHEWGHGSRTAGWGEEAYYHMAARDPEDHPVNDGAPGASGMVLKPAAVGAGRSCRSLRLHCRKPSCLSRGRAGPGPTGTHDIRATGTLV